MKIVLGYASLDDPRGFPNQAQNRQAQFFHTKAAIFPVVPATAATVLARNGHPVLWQDGPAQGLTWAQQLAAIIEFAPDLIAWEVKTPTVIPTWARIDELKSRWPSLVTVLMGDHVTALPQESLQQSLVDYVLTGGDYDVGLLTLVTALTDKTVCLQKPFTAFEGNLSRGVWAVGTDTLLSDHWFPDRTLTRWWDYGFEQGSGNYKYLPGTHTMAGRDCWHRHNGGCTFCSWTNTFKNFRVRSVDSWLAELEDCAALGMREVFDDTGTFPIGAWFDHCVSALSQFRQSSRREKFPILGCNLRPGALTRDQYRELARAGFRFVLFGLESANQATLDRLNKGQSPGDMERSARWATEAGLHPHVTAMCGYPWESEAEAQRTLDFTRSLFARGLIRTLQATICIPYPGTRLYDECVQHDWFQYAPGDWNKWDMRQPVMRSPISNERLLAMTRGLYHSYWTPRNVLRTVARTRTLNDAKFLWRGAKLLMGHLTDFAGRQVR